MVWYIVIDTLIGYDHSQSCHSCFIWLELMQWLPLKCHFWDFDIAHIGWTKIEYLCIKEGSLFALLGWNFPNLGSCWLHSWYGWKVLLVWMIHNLPFHGNKLDINSAAPKKHIVCFEKQLKTLFFSVIVCCLLPSGDGSYGSLQWDYVGKHPFQFYF